MKQLVTRALSVLVCIALLCIGLTACQSSDTNATVEPTVTTTSTEKETYPTQTLVDATDSPLLGSWSVATISSPINEIEFREDGSLTMSANANQLGGTFVFDSATNQLTIHTSSSTMEGSCVFDGDTVTFTSANDTWVLTKV